MIVSAEWHRTLECGASSLSKKYVLESHFMDTSTRGAAMLESALPT